MKKILIMTLGTTKASKMIPSYKLLFEETTFDEILIVRSEDKNSKDQEKAIKEMNKNNPLRAFVISNPDNIEKIISDLNFNEDSFYYYLKKKDKEGATFQLDITGGTKLMSAAVTAIIQMFKSLGKISYITGKRSKETGKAIGAFRKEEAKNFNINFFLNFPKILTYLENKDYISLASFLDDYKKFFSDEKWCLFIDLVNFYRLFLLGKFELLKGDRFLKKSYSQSLIEEILLNKDKLESFFVEVEEYLNIRYSKHRLTEKDKLARAFFETSYFYDRFFNSLKTGEKIASLGYFYVFFEKLVNFTLLRENINLSFVFNKDTFYLSDKEKILGIKEKVNLLKNTSLRSFFSIYLEKIIKKRNLTIIGHGEAFPDEEIFKQMFLFIKELRKFFPDIFDDEYVLTYPEFNLKKIFFS